MKGPTEDRWGARVLPGCIRAEGLRLVIQCFLWLEGYGGGR